MIRKLKEGDREELMHYLLREPAYNLFIIGDVENYGFDRDFQELWGEFTPAGLNAVLLRYYSYLIISSKGADYDVDGFAKIVEGLDFRMISGKEEAMRPLTERLDLTDIRTQYLAELASPDSLLPVGPGDVEWLTVENYREVLELHRAIAEFGIVEVNEEAFLRPVKDGTGRTCFIRRDGKPVSTASSAAETAGMAMLIAVGTLTKYRKRGYASLSVSALCRALIHEGKTVYLLYDNPDAGRIYRRLGFREIGEWLSASKGQKVKSDSPKPSRADF